MRKGLARSIVLGLMVTTLGYGGMAEGGYMFNSGTHDIGGEYNFNDYFVVTTETVNLNAISDVRVNNNRSDRTFIMARDGGQTHVNMNGNNLTISGTNQFLNTYMLTTPISSYTGSITIDNAHNISVIADTPGGSSIAGFAYGGDTNFTINASGTFKIEDNGGSDSVLVWVGTYGNHSGQVNINANEGISLTGNSSTIVGAYNKNAKMNLISKNGNINITALKGKGVRNSGEGGEIIIQGKYVNVAADTYAVDSQAGTTDITATSGNIALTAPTAIISSGTGEINLHSDTTITATEKDISATGGAVTFDKALTATAAPVAVEASGGAKVTAMNASYAKQVAGTMTADGAGTSVDMKFLTGDSYYTGATTVSNDGAINLAFANGAPWNVTADSSLTSLENNSVVNMAYSGNGNYETVTTDTLSGAGSFTMNTDLQASKDNLDVTTNSDKLVITGTSSGTHTIDVEDTSLLSGKKSEGYLLLVEDKTSGGATFVGGDVAKGGLYKYTPLIISVNPGDNPDILDTYNNVPTGNVKNWYLAGYEKSGELQPVVAPLIGAGDNRYAAYRFEQDNLLLRLGELRDNENSQGIWARVKTAKETVNDTTDSRFTMYQVGYDKKYKDDENGRKYFGVAFNHTKGKQDYSSTSNGESSANAMTLYNTWLGKKGHYLDLVGKVGKINTDWDYSNARFPDSGDSKAWFYSLSGEYGRKIMNKDGFYTEPQAQLTYGHINGAGYTSDSGINVDQDSINSLIGRVGFTIGKHFNGDEDGKRTNVYAKLFYNHEFLGDSDVRMNDTYGDSYTHSGDFGGSWWTAGVGVTAQLDKKTNAYFDVQKTFGGDIDQKWQFNVGLRWNWGGAKKAAPVETVAPVETLAPVAAAPMADYYMDSVHFDTDQDVIRADQEGKVSHFAEVAKENPNHTFKLVGNTDSDASDSYNEDLSRRRVERVKNAAENKGVPAAQIQTNYKGEKDPASSNATAQGKADNRRVDMWEHK